MKLSFSKDLPKQKFCKQVAGNCPGASARKDGAAKIVLCQTLPRLAFPKTFLTLKENASTRHK